MKNNRFAAASGEPTAELSPSVSPQSSWTLTFLLLAALLITLTWYPLARLNAHYEMGPNEGFNAYFQHITASGEQVYGQAPVFYYANYPPLSFHLVGTLGRLAGDPDLAGRWVSLLSYLLTGGLIALIVERLGAGRRHALHAALCWLIWLAALDPSRIGFNDPHLLGMALNIAAFYCFLRDRESTRWLAISAVLFALSLFTKQTLLVFPAAVAIDLFFRGARRRFLLWAGVLCGASILFLALTLAIDGRYFLDHLLLPRTYSMAGVLGNAVTYLSFVQTAFAVALFWILRGAVPDQARVLIWAFALGHVLGLVFCAGDGAAVNHLFDAMAAAAMIIGVFLPALESLADQSALPRAALAAMLILPFFLASILVLPQRVPLDIARYDKGIPALQSEFGNAVQFIRSQPGPALCENLLLCYEAGKPILLDAFAADQAIKTGKLDEAILLQQLAARKFGMVQIEITQGEVVRPVARHRFSAAFMTQLLAAYHLTARSSRHAFFLPNPAGQ